MDILIAFVFPALAGIVIGILSGLLGIGGGTLMIPLFRLVFGMSPMMSTATSLFTIVPTSIAGVVGHIRNKTCYIAFGLAAGLGGACTSPVGVYLATLSPGWAVIVGTAIVIAYSSSTMLVKAIRSDASPKKGMSAVAQNTSKSKTSTFESGEIKTASSESDGAAGVARTRTFSPKQLIGAFAIGLATGVAAGYVGLGGGFLMVPLMVTFYKMPMKYASGTSLLTVMILAIPGVITQAFFGNINYLAGLAIAAGSVPGALIGAKLINRVPERALKLIFGGFLIIAAIMLVVNEFVFA